MTFTFNGAQANVSLSGAQALPQPSSDQTPIQPNGIRSTNGTTIIYTCPADTRAYITSWSLGTQGNAGNFGIKFAGDIWFYTSGTSPMANALNSPAVLEAGETIELVAGGTPNGPIYCGCTGYEVSTL